MAGMNLSTWQGLRSRDPRRLALGSVRWAMPDRIANRDDQLERRELQALLASARGAGIRVLDTARAYGDSERAIGNLVQPEEGWRILTKLAPDVLGDGLGLAEVLERVATSLAESQDALRLDVLPTLLLHRFAHRHVTGGRLWRMLLAERDAGRIGSLGVCAATPEEAWAALEDPDIEVLQVASSLLDLRLHRQGFFPRARELGRTVYVRSIYLHGVAHLEPRFLPPALSGLAKSTHMIRRRASELGVPTRALYLAFVRDLPGALPVLGCERAVQLQQLLGDWASGAVDAAQLSPLVDALPTLPDQLLDSRRWPRFELRTGRRSKANQAAARSIATMPA